MMTMRGHSEHKSHSPGRLGSRLGDEGTKESGRDRERDMPTVLSVFHREAEQSVLTMSTVASLENS